MRPSAKRSKRTSLLAAPIVVTAMFTPACEGRTYRNPRSPQEPQTTATAPTATPDGTALPTGEPIATATPSPTEAAGTVKRMPDGSCLLIYPDPTKDCPPEVDCNPGPPREPRKIKCPESNGP